VQNKLDAYNEELFNLNREASGSKNQMHQQEERLQSDTTAKTVAAEAEQLRVAEAKEEGLVSSMRTEAQTAKQLQSRISRLEGLLDRVKGQQDDAEMHTNGDKLTADAALDALKRAKNSKLKLAVQQDGTVESLEHELRALKAQQAKALKDKALFKRHHLRLEEERQKGEKEEQTKAKTAVKLQLAVLMRAQKAHAQAVSALQKQEAELNKAPKDFGMKAMVEDAKTSVESSKEDVLRAERHLSAAKNVFRLLSVKAHSRDEESKKALTDGTDDREEETLETEKQVHALEGEVETETLAAKRLHSAVNKAKAKLRAEKETAKNTGERDAVKYQGEQDRASKLHGDIAADTAKLSALKAQGQHLEDSEHGEQQEIATLKTQLHQNEQAAAASRVAGKKAMRAASSTLASLDEQRTEIKEKIEAAALQLKKIESTIQGSQSSSNAAASADEVQFQGKKEAEQAKLTATMKKITKAKMKVSDAQVAIDKDEKKTEKNRNAVIKMTVDTEATSDELAASIRKQQEGIDEANMKMQQLINTKSMITAKTTATKDVITEKTQKLSSITDEAKALEKELKGSKTEQTRLQGELKSGKTDKQVEALEKKKADAKAELKLARTDVKEKRLSVRKEGKVFAKQTGEVQGIQKEITADKSKHDELKLKLKDATATATTASDKVRTDQKAEDDAKERLDHLKQKQQNAGMAFAAHESNTEKSLVSLEQELQDSKKKVGSLHAEEKAVLEKIDA